MYKYTLPFVFLASSMALAMGVNGYPEGGFSLLSFIPYILIFAAGLFPGKSRADNQTGIDTYQLIFHIDLDENGKAIIPKGLQNPGVYKPVVFENMEMKDSSALRTWINILKKHKEIKRVRIDLVGNGSYRDADEKINMMREFMIAEGISEERLRIGSLIKSKKEAIVKIEIEEIGN